MTKIYYVQFRTKCLLKTEEVISEMSLEEARSRLGEDLYTQSMSWPLDYLRATAEHPLALLGDVDEAYNTVLNWRTKQAA